MREQCPERTHFTKYAAEALTKANNESAAPSPPLLVAICDAIAAAGLAQEPVEVLEDVLELRGIQYAQLVLKRNPPSTRPNADNPAYVPEETFVSYSFTESISTPTGEKQETKQYVQAPRSEVCALPAH